MTLFHFSLCHELNPDLGVFSWLEKTKQNKAKRSDSGCLRVAAFLKSIYNSSSEHFVCVCGRSHACHSTISAYGLKCSADKREKPLSWLTSCFLTWRMLVEEKKKAAQLDYEICNFVYVCMRRHITLKIAIFGERKQLKLFVAGA